MIFIISSSSSLIHSASHVQPKLELNENDLSKENVLKTAEKLELLEVKRLVKINI